MKHNCQLEINVPPEIKIYGEKNELTTGITVSDV